MTATSTLVRRRVVCGVGAWLKEYSRIAFLHIYRLDIAPDISWLSRRLSGRTPYVRLFLDHCSGMTYGDKYRAAYCKEIYLCHAALTARAQGAVSRSYGSVRLDKPRRVYSNSQYTPYYAHPRRFEFMSAPKMIADYTFVRVRHLLYGANAGCPSVARLGKE